MKGVLLEDLTWLEAKRCLTPETVVAIPLGAAAKEHGPHLRLNKDRVLAEYFKKRILEEAVISDATTGGGLMNKEKRVSSYRLDPSPCR